MTREHKLALIVGFSLVLIVGVLISDHFSPARTQDVSAGAMSAGTPVGFGSSPDGLRVPAEATTRTALPDTLTSHNVANRLPEQPSYQPPAPPVQQQVAQQPIPQPVDPLATQGNTPPELVMGSPQIPESLRQDFEPATGAIGERLAANDQIPVSGGSGAQPDTVLSRPVNQVTPPPVITTPTKPQSSGAIKRYTIQEGDSIYRVAATQYGDGTLWSKLREFNPGKIGSEGEVREGSVIELPPKDVLLGQAVLPTPGTKTPSKAPPKVDSPQKREGNAPGYTVYVVQRGDELGTVARKTLGTSKRWPEIAALNKDVLPDPDTLTAGMKLRIPSR